MMPISHKQKKNKNRVIQGLVLLWLCQLYGCGSISMGAQKDLWLCDEHADAAVAQEKWQQALIQHKQFLSVDPRNCLAMYHIGYIWGKLEDPSQEVAWYQKSVSCGYTQSDVLFFNMGMAYADLHQMDKAIDAFDHATKVNPRGAENYFGLAFTAQAMGNTPLAEQSLAHAISIAPNHLESRILLAKIYLDQGRLDAARTQLERVLNHAPDNEAAADLWRLYEDRVSNAYER